MITDLISDMLTRIRNGIQKNYKIIYIKSNKIILEILNVLKLYGFIIGIQIDKNNSSYCYVYLKYKGWWLAKSYISKLTRISKPGCRIFSSYKNFNKYIPMLHKKYGIICISTSSGIMSHLDAISLKKGGEILFYIE